MATVGTTEAGASLDARISIDSVDHLVLTVRDVESTIAFYAGVLGMRTDTFGDGRHALRCGDRWIDLHAADDESLPRAANSAPGSSNLCFVTRTPVEGVLRVLEDRGVEVEQGPLERSAPGGQLLGVCFRDPDGNLVELANRLDG